MIGSCKGWNKSLFSSFSSFKHTYDTQPTAVVYLFFPSFKSKHYKFSHFCRLIVYHLGKGTNTTTGHFMNYFFFLAISHRNFGASSIFFCSLILCLEKKKKTTTTHKQLQLIDYTLQQVPMKNYLLMLFALFNSMVIISIFD